MILTMDTCKCGPHEYMKEYYCDLWYYPRSAFIIWHNPIWFTNLKLNNHFFPHYPHLYDKVLIVGKYNIIELVKLYSFQLYCLAKKKRFISRRYTLIGINYNVLKFLLIKLSIVTNGQLLYFWVSDSFWVVKLFLKKSTYCKSNLKPITVNKSLSFATRPNAHKPSS